MRKANNILELIGHTPVVRLNRLADPAGAEIWAKLEFFNPGGSIKDRIGLAMIEDAEQDGRLKPGSVIVEPTSGNTGVGLSMAAAVKGYRLILVMPESMSIERRKLFAIYGAEFVLTPREDGMDGAVNKARELVASNDNYFLPQQFENPSNPAIHQKTTAQEILEQLPDLDAFVAGVGTGGTITGVGRVLKEKVPGIKVVAVEPYESQILAGGTANPHRIQGIGANFVPKVFDPTAIDQILPVKADDAVKTAKQLAGKEGILAGISGGAAIFAALSLAKELGAGKKVLAIIPDTGERYISTELFD